MKGLSAGGNIQKKFIDDEEANIIDYCESLYVKCYLLKTDLVRKSFLH